MASVNASLAASLTAALKPFAMVSWSGLVGRGSLELMYMPLVLTGAADFIEAIETGEPALSSPQPAKTANNGAIVQIFN
ncbi:hypothetical protein WS68_15490 [Burkholderia sp. TSV86]|nr:hypothetical protein WS68_15490 [Burkholderia sp. TSV86]